MLSPASSRGDQGAALGPLRDHRTVPGMWGQVLLPGKALFLGDVSLMSFKIAQEQQVCGRESQPSRAGTESSLPLSCIPRFHGEVSNVHIIRRSQRRLLPCLCDQLAVTHLPSLRMHQEPQRPWRSRNIISQERERRLNASGPTGEAKVDSSSRRCRGPWCWMSHRPVSSRLQPDAKKNTN